MAQILLHGTLHASIFEAESLSNPHRASGSAPKFIRKVTCSVPSLVSSSLSLNRFIAACPNEPLILTR
jgi:hypothetical protein